MSLPECGGRKTTSLPFRQRGGLEKEPITGSTSVDHHAQQSVRVRYNRKRCVNTVCCEPHRESGSRVIAGDPESDSKETPMGICRVKALIPTPVPRVWEFIIDPRNMPLWVPYIESVAGVDRPLQVGDRLTQWRRDFFRLQKTGSAGRGGHPVPLLPAAHPVRQGPTDGRDGDGERGAGRGPGVRLGSRKPSPTRLVKALSSGGWNGGCSTRCSVCWCGGSRSGPCAAWRNGSPSGADSRGNF